MKNSVFLLRIYLLASLEGNSRAYAKLDLLQAGTEIRRHVLLLMHVCAEGKISPEISFYKVLLA